MTADADHDRPSRRELARLLPEAGWPVVAGLVSMAGLQVAVPLAIIATTGTLVGRVTSGAQLGAVAGPLVLLAVLFGVQQVIAPVQNVFWYKATSRIDGAMRVRAMRAASLPVGVELLEDQALQDAMPLAAGKPTPFRSATPGGAAVGVIGLTARFFQAVGAAALVARVSVIAAALLLAATVVFRRLNHRVAYRQARAFDDHVPAYRLAGYFSGLALDPGPAKELRVFGLADWVRERHARAWDQVTGSMAAVRWTSCRRVGAYYLALAPLHAAVFAAAGLAALDGRIDLATLAVVVQASRQLIDLGNLTGDDYQIDFGAAALPCMHALERQASEARLDAPSGTRPADGYPSREIRFEGLTFAYPGSDRLVFEDLDLVVRAGTSMAIVGANGAGKTTLVKLLARLYEPAAGRILVDGVDIAELDPESWRARLAVIFQDFVRYELSAADNVGLGAPSLPDDRPALATAAERAGTLDLIEALPEGWDTVLARGYTGGCDLSGGEWQRVALARALFAVEGGATVLALDEPTANLDVRAEAQLFDRLLDVTSGPRGLTTLLISHRFSTVRRADQICVLDQGRVVELGSHEALVTAGGRYARMFALQAARFNA